NDAVETLMKRLVVAVSIVAVTALSGRAFQGQPAGAAPAGPPAPQTQGPKVVESQQLAPNLYMLTGGGGNSALFVTADNGSILIDTKNPGWGGVLQEKILTLTNKPVTTVINTHTHA